MLVGGRYISLMIGKFVVCVVVSSVGRLGIVYFFFCGLLLMFIWRK